MTPEKAAVIFGGLIIWTAVSLGIALGVCIVTVQALLMWIKGAFCG
jgi:hypothetical protein